MTRQEITVLRKSGRLDEALAAAEENFKVEANGWTASSLFWCLNDLCKRSDSNLNDLLERMRFLYDTYCSGDDFMEKTLASIERNLMPHALELRSALEKAKNGGNVIQDCSLLMEYFNNNEIDQQMYNNLGWLIYYALKQTPVNAAAQRKVLLKHYLELNLETPSVLHSQIMREAVVIEKNTPLEFLFSSFVELWDLKNLREEDWQQFRTDDGKTLPSLVEKIIGVYVKEMHTNHSQASESFCVMFEKALALFPNNQNLPYFKAHILISQGKKEEAMSYYRDQIIRFPMKSYLWNQLAELVDDIDTKIGLLCSALKSGDKEEFLGNIRLRLANLMYDKGLYSNAKCELSIYYTTNLNCLQLSLDLDIERVFRLYGSSLSSKSYFKDYTQEDEQACKKIKRLRGFNTNEFNDLFVVLDRQRKSYLQRKEGGYDSDSGESSVDWSFDSKDRKVFDVKIGSKRGELNETICSPHAMELLFNSGWFEYEVAKIFSRWDATKVLLMNCVVKSSTNKDLNEIDLIINTGTKILFVECKTQIHNITDIDKFRSVVKNYGGLGSVGIFITDETKTTEAKEKCKKNGIIEISLSEYRDKNNKLNESTIFNLLNATLSQINTR